MSVTSSRSSAGRAARRLDDLGRVAAGDGRQLESAVAAAEQPHGDEQVLDVGERGGRGARRSRCATVGRAGEQLVDDGGEHAVRHRHPADDVVAGPGRPAADGAGQLGHREQGGVAERAAARERHVGQLVAPVDGGDAFGPDLELEPEQLAEDRRLAALRLAQPRPRLVVEVAGDHGGLLDQQAADPVAGAAAERRLGGEADQLVGALDLAQWHGEQVAHEVAADEQQRLGRRRRRRGRRPCRRPRRAPRARRDGAGRRRRPAGRPSCRRPTPSPASVAAWRTCSTSDDSSTCWRPVSSTAQHSDEVGVGARRERCAGRAPQRPRPVRSEPGLVEAGETRLRRRAGSRAAGARRGPSASRWRRTRANPSACGPSAVTSGWRSSRRRAS